jgi:hypothetical protein
MNGYYRLREACPDHGGNHGWGDYVGTLFYIQRGRADDDYKLFYGKHTWYIDQESLGYFDFVPNGIQERQAEMARLMSEVEEEELALIHDHQKLLGTSEDADEETPQPVLETGLVPENEATAIRMNKKLMVAKTQFAKTQELMKQRSKELQGFLEEQKSIIASKAEALEVQIKMATQAMSVLQTYTGALDELTPITRGEPAPAETKLVMRQLLLYMDEEMAIARSKGIDYTETHLFDEWLKDPDHRDQVMPEEKGVVALKPRRRMKDYGDSYLNKKLNEHNKKVYILIRNGENLSRIYTDLELEEVLFPRADEFEQYFYEEERDWKTNEKTKKPLRPGSRQYMEAMEKAGEMQQEYFKVFILLQGLFDRTKLFEPTPTPGERVNICNLDSLKWIHAVYDAQNLLGDGRPDYEDWLTEINSNIDVGVRIMGSFDRMDDSKEESRISPRKAGKPSRTGREKDKDDVEFYTLEKREGTGFRFLYDYETYYGDKSKRRASCLVLPEDDFILNIDSAEIEDMEYYLKSRVHRHEYWRMVPHMQRAILLKKKEKKEEKPFRLLLMGQIAKEHGVSVSEAEEIVDELIHWWKFKNFEHRALKKDDAKALRMIVEEYGRRLALKNEPAEPHIQLVESIPGEHVLATFLRKKNEYTILRWQNDKNIHVREESWKVAKGKMQLEKATDWTVVDKRHFSWRLLTSNVRWDSWEKLVRPHKYLTDPEIQQGLHSSGLDLEKDVAAVCLVGSTFRFYVPKDFKPVAKNRLYSESPDHPGYNEKRVIWSKNRRGVQFDVGSGYTYGTHNGGAPWESDQYESKTLLFKNSKILAKVAANRKIAKKLDKIHYALRKEAGKFVEQISELKEAKFYADEKVVYFRDHYEDEELWEKYKKKILKDRAKYHNAYWLKTPVGMLLERGHDPVGMTIKAVVELAKTFGYGRVTKEDRFYHSRDNTLDVMAEDLPIYGDVVLKKPEEDEEEEEEEVEDDDDE